MHSNYPYLKVQPIEGEGGATPYTPCLGPHAPPVRPWNPKLTDAPPPARAFIITRPTAASGRSLPIVLDGCCAPADVGSCRPEADMDKKVKATSALNMTRCRDAQRGGSPVDCRAVRRCIRHPLTKTKDQCTVLKWVSTL